MEGRIATILGRYKFQHDKLQLLFKIYDQAALTTYGRLISPIKQESIISMRTIIRNALLTVSLLLLTLVFGTSTGAQTPDGFVVTIIGSGNPLLSSKRAGPSVLVEYKDKQFLVDCGTSAITNLLKLNIKPEKIDNMLFTHHHVDHNADYVSFAVGGWGMPGGRRKLNLIGPIGTKSLHQMILSFYKTDLDYRTQVVGFPEAGIRSNIYIKELEGETENFELDGINISALLVPHTIETYAYRFDAGGQSVVISGDMTFTNRFAPFAKGADILIFDGQMSVDFSNLPPQTAKLARQALLNSHISNQEIAKVAADTSPGKIVLTHLSGTMNLQDNIQLYENAGYKGKVIEAYDGLVITP